MKNYRNNIFAYICLCVLITALLYALFVFGTWQINPGRWKDETRSGFAWLLFMFYAIMVPISLVDKIYKL